MCIRFILSVKLDDTDSQFKVSLKFQHDVFYSSLLIHVNIIVHVCCILLPTKPWKHLNMPAAAWYEVGVGSHQGQH